MTGKLHMAASGTATCRRATVGTPDSPRFIPIAGRIAGPIARHGAQYARPRPAACRCIRGEGRP